MKEVAANNGHRCQPRGRCYGMGAVTPQLRDAHRKEVQDQGQRGLPPRVAVRPSDLRDAGHWAHALDLV